MHIKTHYTPTTTHPTTNKHKAYLYKWWPNGTRCRDGVKVLWCHSHLVWLVIEASIPTCTCFASENFLWLVHCTIPTYPFIRNDVWLFIFLSKSLWSAREQPDVDVASMVHTATMRSRNAVVEVKPLESLAILAAFQALMRIASDERFLNELLWVQLSLGCICLWLDHLISLLIYELRC